jgi:hypothetical protein
LPPVPLYDYGCGFHGEHYEEAMSEPTPAAIRVEYTPAFRDYLWLTAVVLYRRLWWGLWLSPLPLLAALFVLVGTSDGPATAEGVLAACAFALSLPVLFLVVLPVAAYLSARRQWRTAEALREHKTYEFSDAGIAVEADTASGKVAWSNVARADLVRGLVILTYTQPMYLFVSAKVFTDAGMREAFAELLRRKVRDCRGF